MDDHEDMGMDPETIHFKVPVPDSVRQSRAEMATDRNALFQHAINVLGILTSVKYNLMQQPAMQFPPEDAWKGQVGQPPDPRKLGPQEEKTLQAALRYLEREFDAGPKPNVYVHDFAVVEDEDGEKPDDETKTD